MTHSSTSAGLPVQPFSPVRSTPQRRRSAPRLGVLSAAACAAVLAGTSALHAQEDDLDNIGLFFRFGATVRAGVKAEIHDVAPIPNHGPGGFDDGFVLPDASGSTTDTWNWGFNSQSQLAEGRMALHKTDNAPRVGSLDGLGDSTLFGGELIGGFEMFRTRMGRRDVRFGFELGYGYSTFSAKATASATSTATYTTAIYDLSGITPPATPSYAGTYEGPGPIIPLNPLGGGAVDAAGFATLSATIDTDLHTLKVGPWVDVPITKHFLIGGSFGLASIYANPELSFVETVSYADGGIPAPAPLKASVTRSDWRPGFYIQLRATYDFNRRLGVFVGGDFQWNKDLVFNGAGREVRLNFEATYGASAGLNLRF